MRPEGQKRGENDDRNSIQDNGSERGIRIGGSIFCDNDSEKPVKSR